MADKRSNGNHELHTLVIRFPLGEGYLQRLRDRFPDLTIVLTKDDASFRAQLPEADAIVGWGLNDEELALAPRLRWIQTVGAGVDTILTPALVARNLILTNNSGVHAPNIAEHLMAMMLAFARRLPDHVRHQGEHSWGHGAIRDRIFELNEQSLLVVGLGDIGQALAKRASAFGMTVTGVRRREGGPVEGVDEIVLLDDLHRALSGADHVAICLPLTKATTRLFDAAALAEMKEGSYLYNIGRGPIIDQEALIEALRSGHLAGAGLDVTDPEPLPPDSPLWDFENVLITSHTSGVTPRYWDRAIVILEENVARYRAGTEMLNVVDQAMGY